MVIRSSFLLLWLWSWSSTVVDVVVQGQVADPEDWFVTPESGLGACVDVATNECGCRGDECSQERCDDKGEGMFVWSPDCPISCDPGTCPDVVEDPGLLGGILEVACDVVGPVVSTIVDTTSLCPDGESTTTEIIVVVVDSDSSDSDSSDSDSSSDGDGTSSSSPGGCYDIEIHKCGCQENACSQEKCEGIDRVWTDQCPNHCDPEVCDGGDVSSSSSPGGCYDQVIHKCGCQDNACSQQKCEDIGRIWTDQCPDHCDPAVCAGADTGGGGGDNGSTTTETTGGGGDGTSSTTNGEEEGGGDETPAASTPGGCYDQEIHQCGCQDNACSQLKCEDIGRVWTDQCPTYCECPPDEETTNDTNNEGEGGTTNNDTGEEGTGETTSNNNGNNDGTISTGTGDGGSGTGTGACYIPSVNACGCADDECSQDKCEAIGREWNYDCPAACDPATCPDNKTILDTATELGSFKYLLSALDVADLQDFLNLPGPFTLFAPTDVAFRQVEGLYGIMNDPEVLTELLMNHVVVGTVHSSDLYDGDLLSTGGNRVIDVKTMSNGMMMLNNAYITTADIETSNGVIHIVDSVLSFPEEDSSFEKSDSAEGTAADTPVVANGIVSDEPSSPASTLGLPTTAFFLCLVLFL